MGLWTGSERQRPGGDKSIMQANAARFLARAAVHRGREGVAERYQRASGVGVCNLALMPLLTMRCGAHWSATWEAVCNARLWRGED